MNFKIDLDILKLLIRIGLPMMLSQSTYAIMVFTDRYFMSLISPAHVAATLSGGAAAQLCLAFFMGLLSYTNALVARQFGARRQGRCAGILGQALWLSVISLVPLAVLSELVMLLLPQFGHSELQLQLEGSYYLMLMAGSVLTLAKIAFSSYFAGLGQTHSVMISDLLAVLINVPITYVLVFGIGLFPELGIIGAAFGTIVGHGFALLLYVLFFLRPGHRHSYAVRGWWRLDAQVLKQFLREGVPSGLDILLLLSSFTAFVLFYQSYGVVAGAASAIVFNWDLVSYVPMIGLHIAVISLVGRFHGAGDIRRLQASIHSGFLLAIMYSGFWALMFLMLRDPMVELFVTEGIASDELRALARWMMLGMASYVIADAMQLMATGVLRGVGDTSWLMRASALIHLSMVAIQYLVTLHWQLPPRVSWLVFVALILSLAVTFSARLRYLSRVPVLV